MGDLSIHDRENGSTPLSLLDYERKFSQLRANSTGDHKSPHKVAMLTVVIDLIASGDIASNQIPFSDQLKTRFVERLKELGTPNDRPNPHLPYFHLRSEGFWHHQIRPGKSEQYAQLNTVGGPGAINEHILYAYLDDELFELLQNHCVRELLRQALFTNLDERTRALILNRNAEADWLECEFIVAEYLEMLLKDLSGLSIEETAHLKKLARNLKENDDQIWSYLVNISAILTELGLPYLPKYQPDFNYDATLYQVVLAHIAAQPSELIELSDLGETTPDNPGSIDWENVADPHPPKQLPHVKEPKRQYLARTPNYSEREHRNRKLGESGESFVMEYEQYRLTQAGRQDLAKEIKWESNNRGDGLGYDILSFDPVTENQLFLEVKTTQSGKYQPFYISENERAFSNDYADDYRLYRVYQFGDQPKLFVLPGAIERYAALLPQQYRVSFG